MEAVINNHIVEKIQLLGGTYDPESALSLMDQLLICESLAEATPISENWEPEIKAQENTSVSGNGSVNGGCKLPVKFELTDSKLDVISKLRTYTYKTPPVDIAELLEIFFGEYESKQGHWLYIAQHWPPRPIIRVIDEMEKAESSGRISIQNAAAYFTNLIKFRERRKIYEKQ